MFRKYLKKNRRFLISILLLFAFRWSLADQYVVPSGSMEPTIHVGDHIFVSKMAYHLKVPFTNIRLMSTSEPRRGEIIVFSHPENGICLVKRLVGLPGDQIEILNGFIKINGEWVSGSESGFSKFENFQMRNGFTYIENRGSHRSEIQRLPLMARSEYLKFTVPKDQFFAMGDNRDNSLDSRSWGFLKKEDLRGRALGVLFNFNFSFQEGVQMDFGRFGKRFL